MSKLDPALEAWRARGSFYSVKPLALHVFALDLGDSGASSDDTLLLLHGFPESSFSFNKVVDGLRNTFARIVLLDMPGYGFSDKPGAEYSYSLVPQADSVLQVWQQLGVRGGHVLSHDMGTSVLTELVARHVNRQLPASFSDGLKSITFTNGSMVLKLAKLRLMQKLLLNKAVGPLVSSQARYAVFRQTVLSGHGVGIGSPGGLSEQDIQLLWQGCTLQNGHQKNHHLIRYLNDRKRFESTRWLPALKLLDGDVPIHICWGDADQVARVEMAHYLQAQICPSASLSIMPSAGHFCQLGSPALWLDTVSQFFGDLSSFRV
ncbi:alpha/beta fold hydrolase [Arenicella xantha]|uniref:Pimeloyl-ACP methyl ester carboxylesterase n=1 Tax=Arenicella xantha TaxID=644221 RepID=A0A395JRH4_9GAMM|nr:alpha/beta hydrolase [Arenicella xantha]RBP53056.1 pimeloyl-ACP methyl ester carboxylesterase [Arenicella xantha]